MAKFLSDFALSFVHLSAGTSTLHDFFQCGGKKSSHYFCGKQLCALCMFQSAKEGLPPFEKCRFSWCRVKDFDAYSQLDNGRYFPQVEQLNQIHKAYPNATFMLTFRSMESWYRSISNYYTWKRSLKDVMRNITGLPAGKGSNAEEFSQFFCNHVKRVRQFVEQHPSHSLVEVDIECDTSGSFMENVFGIGKQCWGRSNANLHLHPELKLESKKKKTVNYFAWVCRGLFEYGAITSQFDQNIVLLSKADSYDYGSYYEQARNIHPAFLLRKHNALVSMYNDSVL